MLFLPLIQATPEDMPLSGGQIEQVFIISVLYFSIYGGWVLGLGFAGGLGYYFVFKRKKKFSFRMILLICFSCGLGCHRREKCVFN